MVAVHHPSHPTKAHILFNAIAPGPFPTWMLSTGVGFGGKVDGVDWDVVGQTIAYDGGTVGAA